MYQNLIFYKKNELNHSLNKKQEYILVHEKCILIPNLHFHENFQDLMYYIDYHKNKLVDIFPLGKLYYRFQNENNFVYCQNPLHRHIP